MVAPVFELVAATVHWTVALKLVIEAGLNGLGYAS